MQASRCCGLSHQTSDKDLFQVSMIRGMLTVSASHGHLHFLKCVCRRPGDCVPVNINSQIWFGQWRDDTDATLCVTMGKSSVEHNSEFGTNTTCR